MTEHTIRLKKFAYNPHRYINVQSLTNVAQAPPTSASTAIGLLQNLLGQIRVSWL